MAEKKMMKAEKKKKDNIFKRIGHRFVEVRLEMKRVIWPTRAKLLQVAVVVLAVILAAAILLSLVGQGLSKVLERFGFYNQVSESTAATTTAAISTDVVSTTAPTTVVTTAATTAAK